MAYVRALPSGSWQASIRRAGYPPQSKVFARKSDADAWVLDVENSMTRGKFVSRVEAESTTLNEALGRYLREVTPKKRGADVETYRIGALMEHELARHTLASVRGVELAQYRDERLADGLSASTIGKELALISHLFETARKEWSISIDNPVLNVSKPTIDNARERRLFPVEEAYLFTALDDSGASVSASAGDRRNAWISLVVRFAIETAARQSEILSLDWKDVDLDAAVVRLRGLDGGKTKNADRFRDVPLSLAAVALLSGDGKVSQIRRGKAFPTTASAIKQSWSRAVARARRAYEIDQYTAGLTGAGLDSKAIVGELRKVMVTSGPKIVRQPPGLATVEIQSRLAEDPTLQDLHFHDLRHEATSRLAEKLQLHELAKVTGHKDVRMLMRYYHPKASDLAKKLG